MIHSIILSMLFAIVGCSGGLNPDLTLTPGQDPAQKIGNYQFDIISGHESVSYTNGQLQGTGVARLLDALPNSKMAANYNITFRLSPGGSLAIVTHAQRTLTNGIELIITWPVNSPHLQVEALTGSNRKDLSQDFVAIDPRQEIRLSMDVHNDHFLQPELIVWSNAGPQPLTQFSLRGNGRGVNWGFRLDRSILTDAYRQNPRETH